MAEIRTQMSTPVSRSYMLERLERSHVFQSCFHTNALTMAFMEGERNIGLQLLNDIMVACPQRYVEMMNERNARDIANDRDDKPTDDDDGDEGHALPRPGED